MVVSQHLSTTSKSLLYCAQNLGLYVKIAAFSTAVSISCTVLQSRILAKVCNTLQFIGHQAGVKIVKIAHHFVGLSPPKVVVLALLFKVY